jgi:hypothetical protein
MHIVVRIAVVALFVVFVGVTGTQAYTIDFEDLPDSTVVTDQYQAFGVQFARATGITAGFSLLEWEFPPHSGSTVVFDDGGPITMLFSNPVASFGAYFTYMSPLMVSFVDSAGQVIAQLSSACGSNLALSGDEDSLPNEFISFASALGISKVIIAGDGAGASFTMDDVMITTEIQEPPPWLLVGFGFSLISLYALPLRRRLLPHDVLRGITRRIRHPFERSAQ